MSGPTLHHDLYSFATLGAERAARAQIKKHVDIHGLSGWIGQALRDAYAAGLRDGYSQGVHDKHNGRGDAP